MVLTKQWGWTFSWERNAPAFVPLNAASWDRPDICPVLPFNLLVTLMINCVTRRNLVLHSMKGYSYFHSRFPLLSSFFRSVFLFREVGVSITLVLVKLRLALQRWSSMQGFLWPLHRRGTYFSFYFRPVGFWKLLKLKTRKCVSITAGTFCTCWRGGEEMSA